MNVLLDRLAPELEQMGYFLLLEDGTLLFAQDGVFRTNCIDCLDRTNVVQSMIAKRVLNDALSRLDILRRIEDHPSVEEHFKRVTAQLSPSFPSRSTPRIILYQVQCFQIWADNADVISIQYSGTGALKTDFTRTGKRTKLGAMRDGVNALTRYYKNNFTDGHRQVRGTCVPIVYCWNSVK